MITIVEIAPEFPGGFQALSEFITTNLNYPQEAKEADVEGRVFVSKPATQRGKPVRMQCQFPIVFKLENENKD